MRILAATVVLAFSFLNIACNVILQPAQQGEWSDSNFRNPKYKISKDFTEPAESEKPPAGK
jgi:hypothetical protein